MILLKLDVYTSNEVAVVLDTNELSVNNCLKRYTVGRVECLRTRSGRGRKPILKQEHLNIVRAAAEQERQRLSQARQIETVAEHIQ